MNAVSEGFVYRLKLTERCYLDEMGYFGVGFLYEPLKISGAPRNALQGMDSFRAGRMNGYANFAHPSGGQFIGRSDPETGVERFGGGLCREVHDLRLRSRRRTGG